MSRRRVHPRENSWIRERVQVLEKHLELRQFPIHIDRQLTLGKMIALGNYYFVHWALTEENFPVQVDGPTDLTASLVHFHEDVNRYQVITKLKAQGLKPAGMVELLAFGAQYPQEQVECPIIALNALCTWGSKEKAVYLFSMGDETSRNISLEWVGDAQRWRPCSFWYKGYSFLAVPL